MKWNKNCSITLSLVCIYIFCAILVVGDAFAFKWIPWFVGSRGIAEGKIILFKLTIYIGSVFGYIALYKLRALLLNIRSGKVFQEENVKLMRSLSWLFAFVVQFVQNLNLHLGNDF